MTEHRDPDRLVHAFILEGEEQLQDRVYDAVRAEIDRHRQRAVIGPWRVPTLNKLVPIALGAAAVVAVILVGPRFLPATTGPGGLPTPSPTASASPTGDPAAGLQAGDTFEIVWPEIAADAPRITVTIPAPGWRPMDPGSGLLIKGDETDNLPEAALISFSESPGTSFYVYGNPCRYSSTTPDTPAATVDAIATALAAQASRDATEPVDVTVDGHPGKLVTLHVPADADFSTCEGGEFATFGTQSDDFARYHQGPTQIDDIWIIDVDGAIVILDFMYRPDTSADLIAEMRSMAESATFALP